MFLSSKHCPLCKGMILLAAEENEQLRVTFTVI